MPLQEPKRGPYARIEKAAAFGLGVSLGEDHWVW